MKRSRPLIRRPRAGVLLAAVGLCGALASSDCRRHDSIAELFDGSSRTTFRSSTGGHRGDVQHGGLRRSEQSVSRAAGHERALLRVVPPAADGLEHPAGRGRAEVPADPGQRPDLQSARCEQPDAGRVDAPGEARLVQHAAQRAVPPRRTGPGDVGIRDHRRRRSAGRRR